MKTNDLFPYCHVELSFRRRAALWLLDRLEMLWEWAHTNTGDGVIGLGLIGAGAVIGVCVACLLGGGR